MNLRKWREAIRDDDSLSRGAKLTAYTISTYAEADTETFAILQTELAEVLGLAARQTRRHMTDLKSAGYFTLSRKGYECGPHCHGVGYPDVHKLTLPKVAS